MESFGFFTKDPKEDQLDIYKVENGKKTKINFRTNSGENLMGLSRMTRRKTYELGVIIRKVPDTSWRKVNEDKLNDIIKEETSLKILKDQKVQLLSTGNYILYSYKPIAWEWNSIKNLTEGKYVFITIK